jgi:tripartite ATP-independent transporter DctP family solute receptor
MKKRMVLVSVILMVLVCAFASASGQQSDEAASGSGLTPMTITLSHPDVVDPQQHTHGSALFFKNYVESKSNGVIKVNIQGGGVLGNTAELQQQVITDTIPNHISLGHTEGTVATVFPDIQIISIPYLFENVDVALGVMDGEFGQNLFDMMAEKTGIRVLGVYDNGFRSLINNVRPVHTPDDVKGLKIRVMSIKAHQEIIKALGGIPVVVPWAELYTALQTGVVDGAENSPATLVLGSLQEVNKYLTLDRHVYSQVHIIANDQWFQSLNPATRDFLAEASRQMALDLRKRVKAGHQKALDLMKTTLVEIYEPTPEEFEMFRKRVSEPVRAIVEKQLDHPELIDELLQAIGDYKS